MTENTATRRPNRKLHESGPEQTVHDDRFTYVLRQVGWIGQSGDFYALDEDPSPTEPGSFRPLLIIAHSDRIEDDPATPTEAERETNRLLHHITGGDFLR